MDKIIGTLGIAFFAALGLFTMYAIFVMAPLSFYAEAKCLRQGYPKAHVTIGMEIYCSNLDGSVTVRVDKQ